MSVRVHFQDRLGTVDFDITLTLERGVGVLFGRSGAGKTSVIRAVSGLWRPKMAQISCGDTVLHDSAQAICLSPQARKIGYIFQEPRLFPHMSVRQNLNFARRRHLRSDVQVEFDRVIDVLGLEPILERGPRHLSGGEQQRVAIARAVLSGPQLLLADEPLAALDAARRSEILTMFDTIVKQFDIPMLYVTHSAAEAARLADQIYIIEGGRVVQHGAALDVLSDFGPRGADGAQESFLAAQVLGSDADGLTHLKVGEASLYIAKPYPTGAPVILRISAHDVILASEKPVGISALNILEGIVTQIQESGQAYACVAVGTSAGVIWARITHRSLRQLGLSVGGRSFCVIKSVAVAQDNI